MDHKLSLSCVKTKVSGKTKTLCKVILGEEHARLSIKAHELLIKGGVGIQEQKSKKQSKKLSKKPQPEPEQQEETIIKPKKPRKTPKTKLFPIRVRMKPNKASKTPESKQQNKIIKSSKKSGKTQKEEKEEETKCSLGSWKWINPTDKFIRDSTYVCDFTRAVKSINTLKDKFHIFETNATKTISQLKLTDRINGVVIKTLNLRLMPTNSVPDDVDLEGFHDTSGEGFIKEGDDLRKILARDNKTVVDDYKISHAELVNPVITLFLMYPKAKTIVHINGEAITIDYPPSHFGRDSQKNPFLNHDNLLEDRLFDVTLTGSAHSLLYGTWGLFGPYAGVFTKRATSNNDSWTTTVNPKNAAITKDQHDLQTIWKVFRPVFISHIEPEMKKQQNKNEDKDNFTEYKYSLKTEKALQKVIDQLEKDNPELYTKIINMSKPNISRHVVHVGNNAPMILKNEKRKIKIEMHSLTLSMIWEFGFYQNGPYRVDPTQLIKLLGFDK